MAPHDKRLREFARAMRKEATEAEKRLWSRLRRRQVEGALFRRQFVIGKYIADFCCPEHALVLELDGGQHAEQEEYDKKRTRFLEGQGYRVLRFWDNEVLANTEGVVQVVMENLSLLPNPPPQGGRE